MRIANATASAATLVVMICAGCGGGSNDMTTQGAATGNQSAAGAASLNTGGMTAGAGATNPSTGGRGATPAATGGKPAAMATGGATPSGGSSGMPGSAMMTAGSNAMAAGAMSMSAGAGGGSAGAPMTSGDQHYIRGAAPTMADSMGTKKGPYATKSYTNGYRDGPNFADATIYYPDAADAEPPYAMVSVVPGFVSPQASIQNWGPFLASHGIATITIGTNSPTDDPTARSLALMDALMTLSAENEREGSPLKGKLDKTHMAVSGWSMGGGGTLIAASQNPTLKCAVSFAAWGPTGGAMNKVPVLMFEATADPLAAGMSNGFYMQTPDSVPKMLFEVSGAGHDVANDPANSDGVIGLYGLSWFKVFLEGDERYKQFLTAAKPSIASTFMTNVK